MLVQFVCVRVCVFPSEMECELFYSRKIAHRANVICCIMYLTLNKFYLINLILSYTVWTEVATERMDRVKPIYPQQLRCVEGIGIYTEQKQCHDAHFMITQ